MSLDYSSLVQLRQNHPAWRLLCAEHAPLVAGFLHRVFVVPNARGIAAVDLAEALEDELFAAREQLSEGAFPKAAIEYLNDWAAADKGWLRKYYPKGTDGGAGIVGGLGRITLDFDHRSRINLAASKKSPLCAGLFIWRYCESLTCPAMAFYLRAWQMIYQPAYRCHSCRNR